jgi:hypothetical protein
MNPEEVIKVVKSLNDKVEHVEEVSETIYWSVTTDGVSSIVQWLGCDLWSSKEDMREFYEDKNDWEPLEDFLIHEQTVLISNISKHDLLQKK